MQLSPLTRHLTYQLSHARHLITRITAEGKSDDIHQFRVAIRRVRSLLQLYLDDTALFPLPLKNFVKQTNILREIDALLSTIRPERYPKTCKRLNLLRINYLHAVFTDSFKEGVISVLEQSYNALCDLNPDPETQEMISKTQEHYLQCRNGYGSLTEKSTKKEFHRLRIKFKIARYALEFLDENSAADEKEKIAECKRFQDALGDIHDSFNHIAWLKKFYKDYPTKEILSLIKKEKKKLRKLKKKL